MIRSGTILPLLALTACYEAVPQGQYNDYTDDADARMADLAARLDALEDANETLTAENTALAARVQALESGGTVSCPGGCVGLDDLADYATITWVEEQGYAEATAALTTRIEGVESSTSGLDLRTSALEAVDTTTLAEVQTWVGEQGFATQGWVLGQGYTTEGWVTGQGYLTPASLTPLAGQIGEVETRLGVLAEQVSALEGADGVTQTELEAWATAQGYATESWVEGRSYLTSGSLTGLTGRIDTLEATVSGLQGADGITQGEMEAWVGAQGYATEGWVTGRGYLTSEGADWITQEEMEGWVTSQGYAEATAALASRMDELESNWSGIEGRVSVLEAFDATILADVQTWVDEQSFATTTYVSDIDARLSNFEYNSIDSIKYINIDTTISVGTGEGQTFRTVSEALSSLDGWIISSNAIVTIAIESGEYYFTDPVVVNHPYGDRIHIIGDDKESVILSFYDTDGIRVENGTSLGYLGGLTIEGSNYTGTHGIAVSGVSSITLGPVSVKAFDIGILVENNSFAEVEGDESITVIDSGWVGIQVSGSSSAYLGPFGVYKSGYIGAYATQNSYLSGPDARAHSSLSEMPEYLGTDTSRTTPWYGFESDRGSSVDVDRAKSSGHSRAGFASVGGGVMYAKSASSVSDKVGFLADGDGYMFAFESSFDDTPSDATATPSDGIAYHAARGSNLNAHSSVVTKSYDGYRVELGSFMDATSSETKISRRHAYSALTGSYLAAQHSTPGGTTGIGYVSYGLSAIDASYSDPLVGDDGVESPPTPGGGSSYVYGMSWINTNTWEVAGPVILDTSDNSACYGDCGAP